MSIQKKFISLISVAFIALGLIFTQSALAATEPIVEAGTHETEILSQQEEHAAENATEEHGEEASHEEVDPGLLGTLGINWKLLIAQLINFGIVLFVLWKWVFKPVSSGLEARTTKIEKSLEDATNIETAKREFESWKNKALSDAQNEAAKIVTDAKTEAESSKKEILDSARIEQDKIIAQTRTALEEERAQTIASIKAEMAEMVVTATQTILGEKLDSTKDKELIKQSLKGL